MKSLSVLRCSFVVIGSLVILASCGGSDDSEASATPETAASVEVQENTTTSDESESIETPTTSDESEPIETTTTVDDRTPEEAAIDSLDLMMLQLGVEDLETASNCVVDRLESEGVEIVGNETAKLVALTACEPAVISEWLPETNPAVPDETWACTVESIGDWINELSIPEAEAFFSAAEPSTEFVELTATRCDVSVEDITAALSL